MPGTLDQAKKREEWLAPLLHFGGDAGSGISGLRFLEAEDLPEPARALLAHEQDMTPTLRDYHAEALVLEVLAAERAGSALVRKVLLRGRESGRVVEFGAIRIDLSQLAGRVRQRVEAGRDPLGGILEEEGLRHSSQPRGFFSALIAPKLGKVIGASLDTRLYGRCNQLTLEDGSVFAEIVELLPPHRPGASAGGAGT
ncbi:MAG TPA: hypothetical protein VMN36_15640 [Verrucomicrobiales bacterium]|nr:hypothetical protein [Verrucomicrobiales bacterium]